MSFYSVQQRTSSGLSDIGQFPAEIVGSMGSAIIESGSNANGNYVKFADGTQVGFFTSPALNASNGFHAQCVFPSAFISRPNIAPDYSVYEYTSDTLSTRGFLYGAKDQEITTTSCVIGVVSFGVKLSNGQARISIIGRWK